MIVPKCPECGTEYEDFCPNCNPEEQGRDEIDEEGSNNDTGEIDEESSNKDTGEIDEESSNKDAGEDAVLLTTVNDNFEASLIETRLKQNDIPVMLKYRESGAYLSFYMGKTSFGVDIYVPAQLLEEARAQIECPPDEESEDTRITDEESLDEAKEEYQKRIESRSWMVFIAIVLIILGAAVITFTVR